MDLLASVVIENQILKSIIAERMLLNDVELEKYLNIERGRFETKEQEVEKWVKRCQELDEKVKELNRQLREEVRYIPVPSLKTNAN